MKHIGTKRLETKRLILRRIEPDDYKMAYKNWCNSDEVDKYVLWTKHENEEVTKKLYDEWILEYEKLDTYRWIIELKETSELVGTIDVSKRFMAFGTCEIGYCLGKNFWNKGIMSESLQAVIKFLFEECDADTIWAEHLENNPASGRVMQKCSMKYEGILRSRIVDKDNKRNNLVVYSLLKDEYFKAIK